MISLSRNEKIMTKTSALNLQVMKYSGGNGVGDICEQMISYFTFERNI